MRIESENIVDLGNGIFLNLKTGCTEERCWISPPKEERNTDWFPTREEVMMILAVGGVFTY